MKKKKKLRRFSFCFGVTKEVGLEEHVPVSNATVGYQIWYTAIQENNHRKMCFLKWTGWDFMY